MWAAATISARGIRFGAMAHLLPVDLPPLHDLSNALRVVAERVVPPEVTGKLVMGVDDVHLVDEASAALLHHLSLTRRVVLLLTRRVHELAPDSVTTLWADGVVEEVRIGPLDLAAMHQLLEAALGSQVQGATARRLWELTQGNPLFLREVLVACLDANSLREVDGVWRWDGPFRPLPGLEALLDARLATLDADARAALEVIALGEPLGPAAVDRSTTLDAISVLERQRLVRVEEDGRRLVIWCAHPLYGEVVRAMTPALRRRRVQRLLAEAVQHTGARRREDVLRVATWHVAGGGKAPHGVVLAAARRALSLLDYPLAERLAVAAVDAGAGVQAAEILAQVVVAQGRFAEGEEMLARLECDDLADDARAQVAIARASNLAQNLGDLDTSLEVLKAAQRAMTDDAGRDEVSAAHAYVLRGAGRTRQAIAEGLSLLEQPRLSLRATAWAAGAAAGALVYAGRTVEARQVMDRWEASLLQGLEGSIEQAVGFDIYRFVADLFDGEFRAAHRSAMHAYERAVGSGAPWLRGLWAGALGAVELRRGSLHRAVRWLRDGLADLHQADMFGHTPILNSELAHALALMGNVDGARAVLDEAQAAESPGLRFAQGYLARGLVWTAVADGERSTAIAVAIDQAELLDRLQFLPMQASVLHDVVRLGAADRVMDRLGALASACDGQLVPAFADHARALAAEDPRALQQNSVTFEAMGGRLLAAEAAAEACRSYRRAGRMASALAAGRRAKLLNARCGNVRTPALDDLEAELPLTRREREVAHLAVRGMTNRDIAERLTLSVRTVDNHLHSIYEKLGIQGRRDLASILGYQSSAPE